jgi:hypothetical protein
LSAQSARRQRKQRSPRVVVSAMSPGSHRIPRLSRAVLQSRPRVWSGLALAAAALLLAATATSPGARAAASPSIEGVWSFNDGQVAIQSEPDGTFTGTVVAPIKFALCSHSSGERIWTQIRQQPDGSYWGLHQWYFQTSACVPNPQLGPTAWRVLETSGGVRYLRVCFSSPGTSQPMIAPDGSSSDVTYGCLNSALVAPLPVQRATGEGGTPTGAGGAEGFKQVVSTPSTKRCFSRRIFQIHLTEPRYDPLEEVVVKLSGHRVAVRRRKGRFVATIDLRGLPRGAFTVVIRTTTVLGHHLSGRRTYHTCVPKRLRPSTRTSHPAKSKQRS